MTQKDDEAGRTNRRTVFWAIVVPGMGAAAFMALSNRRPVSWQERMTEFAVASVVAVVMGLVGNAAARWWRSHRPTSSERASP